MSKKIGVFIVIAVLVCAISMPIFADDVNAGAISFANNVYTFTTTDNYDLRISLSVVAERPYMVEYETMQYLTTSQDISDLHNYFCVCQPIIINQLFINSNSVDLLYSPSYERVQLKLTDYYVSNYISATSTACIIDNIIGDLFGINYGLSSSNSSVNIDFRWNDKYNYNNHLVIPANSNISGSYTCYLYLYYYRSNGYAPNTITPERFAFTLPSDNFSFVPRTSSNPLSVIDDFTLSNADYNTQQILEAYKNSLADAQAVIDGTDDNNTSLNTIHNQEQQWYSQNQQAIESTGLSNFNFSDTQISGLNGVFSLFQRLWTSLGDFTFIYVFTLMISFATFVLRHRPSTRSTTKEKKVSSGSGGDTG